MSVFESEIYFYPSPFTLFVWSGFYDYFLLPEIKIQMKKIRYNNIPEIEAAITPILNEVPKQYPEVFLKCSLFILNVAVERAYFDQINDFLWNIRVLSLVQKFDFFLDNLYLYYTWTWFPGVTSILRLQMRIAPSVNFKSNICFCKIYLL